uniref:Uncharacterized protein n=1 Tax=viral metagenome TaxID=1070528 RepID=A0A6C0BLB2_9ZZZZ
MNNLSILEEIGMSHTIHQNVRSLCNPWGVTFYPNP